MARAVVLAGCPVKRAREVAGCVVGPWHRAIFEVISGYRRQLVRAPTGVPILFGSAA
jgi:hypothetical protein